MVVWGVVGVWDVWEGVERSVGGVVGWPGGGGAREGGGGGAGDLKVKASC